LAPPNPSLQEFTVIYHVSTTARDTSHAQRIISALSDRGIDRGRLSIGLNVTTIRSGAGPTEVTGQVPLTITTTEGDEVPPLKDLLNSAGGINTVCAEESGLYEAV
jgi:hypothetical protein